MIPRAWFANIIDQAHFVRFLGISSRCRVIGNLPFCQWTDTDRPSVTSSARRASLDTCTIAISTAPTASALEFGGVNKASVSPADVMSRASNLHGTSVQKQTRPQTVRPCGVRDRKQGCAWSYLGRLLAVRLTHCRCTACRGYASKQKRVKAVELHLTSCEEQVKVSIVQI